MRKKLTEKPQKVIVGALYKTIKGDLGEHPPFISYEENEEVDYVLQQTSDRLKVGTLMLCLSADLPKRFFLVEEKKNIFAFAVRGLKLVSLPQTEPTSSDS
jgi:hypothetical protein